MLSLPLLVWVGNWYQKYALPTSYLKWVPTSKGPRMTLFELLLTMAGFFVDDYCTAVGFQALEDPQAMFEYNPCPSAAHHLLMRNGLAKTETAAHRLIGLLFQIQILLIQYAGGYTQLSKFYLIATGLMKAYAGYGWCLLKPNPFTFTDWITFKDGRPTPFRLSVPLVHAENFRRGHNPGEGGRRRLTAQTLTGGGWYMRYLPILFPML